MVGDNEAALKSLHNYHQATQAFILTQTDLHNQRRFGSNMASHLSSTMWLKAEWLLRGRAFPSGLSSSSQSCEPPECVIEFDEVRSSC